MSNDALSLFSYEILGLVGRNGASAHDLRQMARHGRLLDWGVDGIISDRPDVAADVVREWVSRRPAT